MRISIIFSDTHIVLTCKHIREPPPAREGGIRPRLHLPSRTAPHVAGVPAGRNARQNGVQGGPQGLNARSGRTAPQPDRDRRPGKPGRSRNGPKHAGDEPIRRRSPGQEFHNETAGDMTTGDATAGKAGDRTAGDRTAGDRTAGHLREHRAKDGTPTGQARIHACPKYPHHPSTPKDSRTQNPRPSP